MIPPTSRRDGVQIRLAGSEDLAAINDIYNYYVLHSTCTYQELPEPMEGREKWFADHGPRHPVIVAEMDGRIVGWGSLSAYHVRSAYRHTVENSVYVHHEFHRRGIGSVILADLIERARAIGHRAIIAGIDGDQQASVKLHEKFGFERVGHLKELGFKFGRWLDVIYMELLVGAFFGAGGHGFAKCAWAGAATSPICRAGSRSICLSDIVFRADPAEPIGGFFRRTEAMNFQMPGGGTSENPVVVAAAQVPAFQRPYQR